MKLENVKKILLKERSELISILENWDKNDVKHVLLAYGELKRRGEKIPSNLEDKLKAFCRANNEKKIDKFLKAFMWANGYNSMEEFYRKVFTGSKKIGENISRNKSVEPNSKTSMDNKLPQKYSALRTIIGIYYFFASLMSGVGLLIIIYYGSNYLNYKNEFGLFIAVITFVIGSILVLGLITMAESIKVFIDIEYNTRKAAERNVK